MSSILDALKKLESEKVEAEQPDYPSGFGPEEAERELVAKAGRRGRARSGGLRLTPLTIVVGGSVFIGLVVAISVAGASYYMLRSTPVVPVERSAQVDSVGAVASEPEVAQRQEAAPRVVEPAPAPVANSVVGEPEPPHEDGTQPAAVVADSPPVEARAASPNVAGPALSGDVEEPAPATVREAPAAPVEEEAVEEPAPVVRPEPRDENAQRVASATRVLAASAADEDEGEVEPAEDPVVPEPRRRVEVALLEEPAMPKPAPSAADADLSVLPVLTNTQRDSLGIPELTINFVGMPTKKQPRPSALINLKKVYVGERIPGTGATLIGVEMHGIGIEVNGQRFFVPH